jgi:structural maintenance of chromosomes protein 5
VKNGQTEGYIEIELRGPSGQKNLVIRRNLKAKSKSSSFTLNGKSATGKEISERIAQLNIQVGNLWCAHMSPLEVSLSNSHIHSSFLPQDRVAEFARMSPQQLLRETQRCAGDDNLTSWHDTLIEEGKDLAVLQQVPTYTATTG